MRFVDDTRSDRPARREDCGELEQSCIRPHSTRARVQGTANSKSVLCDLIDDSQ